MRYVLAFVATAVVFLVMDFAWLSQTNATIYRPVIGELLSPKLRVGPAIAFYVVYLAGLIFFAVTPGLQGGGWKRVALNAAVFGLCAYATYDLTNQATLKVWATKLTLLDLGWGMIVSTVAASAGYFAVKLIKPGSPPDSGTELTFAGRVTAAAEFPDVPLHTSTTPVVSGPELRDRQGERA